MFPTTMYYEICKAERSMTQAQQREADVASGTVAAALAAALADARHRVGRLVRPAAVRDVLRRATASTVAGRPATN